MSAEFIRSFPLLDISVRSGGDGRTVEAYAAVWDTPTPISDADGRYEEQIARTAFDRTLAHRGDKPWPVIFNHGMTLHGTPSPLDSMPIGATVERPRADSVGLWTVARYHAGERADQALESIKSGAISAQSFSGRFIQSDKKTPRGGFRAASDGSLTRVTRTEIAMREFGPAVFAAYPTAAITGVRALSLSDTDQMLLQLILSNLADGDAALDPIVSALCATDEALDQAQTVLSQILGVQNPDEPDTDEGMGMGMDSPDRAAYLSRLTSLATRLNAVSAGTARPVRLGAGDSGDAHSAQLSLSPRSMQIMAALH